MPNAPEPDRDGNENTERRPQAAGDLETETMKISKHQPEPTPEAIGPDGEPERRFTAPGFDAKETQVIATASDAATEVFARHPAPNTPAPPLSTPPPSSKAAVPQAIPPRGGAKPAAKNRNW